MALESFYPYSFGGSEKSVYQLSKYLIDSGYNVSIITPDNNGKKNFSMYENIKIYYFSSSLNFTKDYEYGLFETPNMNSFEQRLKEINPDIFHLHSFSPSLNSFHLRKCKELGISTVFTPRLANNFCINYGELVYKGKKPCNAKVTFLKCLSCNLTRFKKSKNQLKKNIIIITTLLFYLVNYFPKRYPLYYLRIWAKKKELIRASKYCDKVVAISPWVLKAFSLNNLAFWIAS